MYFNGFIPGEMLVGLWALSYEAVFSSNRKSLTTLIKQNIATISKMMQQ